MFDHIERGSKEKHTPSMQQLNQSRSNAGWSDFCYLSVVLLLAADLNFTETHI